MEKIIKILGRRFVKIDGVDIEVELRMSKRDYPIKDEIVFKPYARFVQVNKSAVKILREKYPKGIDKTEEKKNGK